MSRSRSVDLDALTQGREQLSPATFTALRDLLHAHSGIALAGHKLTMVQSRLAKRLRALGLQTYEEYLRRLENPEAPEWPEFINALTTNLTSFFREGHHFTRLVELLKPTLPSRRRLRIWSAGCSTGEEPYTLAMTLLNAFGTALPIEILATDLDTAVLATASKGIYPEARIEDLDNEWKRFAFLRGRGEREGRVCVRPEVRDLITFRQLNLLDAEWPVGSEPFQAIFCRNVMIYFDKPTQRAILSRLLPQMDAASLLYTGHSENYLHAADLIQPCGRTLYRRAGTAA